MMRIRSGPDEPGPDLHPAQLELMVDRGRIRAALVEIDAHLHVLRDNSRAVDALLDIRTALTRPPLSSLGPDVESVAA